MNSKKFFEVGQAYAKMAASFSKDPSTKVGAAILRPDGSVASTGWNGFAPGVVDSQERLEERETKYSITIHAELNSILSAREPLYGYTIFTYPFPPCAHCASVIIKCGIINVHSIMEDKIPDRWMNNFKLSDQILREADVYCFYYLDSKLKNPYID